MRLLPSLLKATGSGTVLAAGLVGLNLMAPSGPTDYPTAAPTPALVGELVGDRTLPASDARRKKKDPFTIGVHLSRPSCPVYWNLDASGRHPIGQVGWTERAQVPAPSGHGTVAAKVGWRYNVNDRWTLIESWRQATPHWGFIERSCLVDPPQRLLSGHAKGPGWHTINFAPAARPTAGTRNVHAAATLRDKPSGFVIGNLSAARPFRWTRACSTNRQWVFGYAPDAHRWGWILASNVGTPCDGNTKDAGTHRAGHAPATAPPVGNGDPAAPAAQASAPPGPTSAAAHAPSDAACFAQYTVNGRTRARATRAGEPIGDVAPGTHVNARSNDGVWSYGYIAKINNGSGGYGWILDERLTRTGTYCR
jgi:hypothetical protein